MICSAVGLRCSVAVHTSPVALDLPPLTVPCLFLVQESEEIRHERVMTASQASA